MVVGLDSQCLRKHVAMSILTNDYDMCIFLAFWQVAVVAYVCQVRNLPLLCFLCFAPVKIGNVIMNMTEYGFSFRHKLSLAICIICKYLDSRLHFNIYSFFTWLIHYLFLPTLFSIEYASSMTSNLFYIYQQRSSQSVVSHLPSDHLPFPRRPTPPKRHGGTVV